MCERPLTHAKENMPKIFQLCTKACACNHMLYMMKSELVIYILFSDQRYMWFSIKNKKYIKVLPDHSNVVNKPMRQIASIKSNCE